VSRAHNRSGATPGDVLIFLATVSLAAALLYPAWSARGFRALVDRAITDVDAVALAARSTLQTSGSWPTPTAAGARPPELVNLAVEDGPFARLEYTLEWGSWNVVDSVVAPNDVIISLGDLPPDSVGPPLRPVVRSVGGLAVHSGDVNLLAELAEHYAEASSFVLDTTWVLVLPERSEAPVARP
jgi:hypothetical protein